MAQANPRHPHYREMQDFASSGYDRLNADLKAIRNDVVGLMGSNKPWEVLVGQRLADITRLPENPAMDSLVTFLGPPVCRHLLGLSEH
jgi:hypothetical protein